MQLHKKENEKKDEVVTSEEVEEKMVSLEEKNKSNEQTTNKGKAIVNHPLIKHLPYLHAPSKKDKEWQYKTLKKHSWEATQCFIFCLNLCYFNLMSYINFTFESLFTNYIFECLICFVRDIIAWHGEMSIFKEEDEDMADPVDYFIGGD